MRLWKKEGNRVKHTMTYRTRRRLHKLGVFCGYFFGILLLVWICWFLWLARYVVYSGNEAKLNFNWVSHTDDAVVARPPEEATVAIHFNEGEELVETNHELAPLSGFYITANDMMENMDLVTDTVKQLPKDSAVMLDLKNVVGSFYYSTKIEGAKISESVDASAVDKLIKTVTQGNYYAIAKVPAFRDQLFGLENDSNGYTLAHSSGGYMWSDEGGCYWMNPTTDGAISYLISIVKELQALGFDEVVFTDFSFPPTEDIAFEGDRAQAITDAAAKMVTSCATNTFAVSFATSDSSFPLPQGRSRLYLTGVDAENVQTAADRVSMPDKQIQLVFLTETNDTRFDTFNVVRPITAAEVTE